jgi:hypothetical protein
MRRRNDARHGQRRLAHVKNDLPGVLSKMPVHMFRF